MSLRQASCYVLKEALPLNAHLPGYEGSIASIHTKSNELFETLSWRIAATRSSSFVKNLGWSFLHERNQPGAASPPFLLRLSPRVPSFGTSSSNMPNRKLGRIVQIGNSANMA
jgi:hypothetical protein